MATRKFTLRYMQTDALGTWMRHGFLVRKKVEDLLLQLSYIELDDLTTFELEVIKAFAHDEEKEGLPHRGAEKAILGDDEYPPEGCMGD